MTEQTRPQIFDDVKSVSRAMGMLAKQFSGSQELAGMGVLATMVAAIAKLADEVDQLKKGSS